MTDVSQIGRIMIALLQIDKLTQSMGATRNKPISVIIICRPQIAQPSDKAVKSSARRQ